MFSVERICFLEAEQLLNKYYLQAACIVAAVFSRIWALPTHDPDAPAIKNGRSSTISCLGDGLKSGRQDKTPCNVESMRKRVTFRCVFSSPAPQMVSMRQAGVKFLEQTSTILYILRYYHQCNIKISAFSGNMRHANKSVYNWKIHIYHWCKTEWHKGMT